MLTLIILNSIIAQVIVIKGNQQEEDFPSRRHIANILRGMRYSSWKRQRDNSEEHAVPFSGAGSRDLSEREESSQKLFFPFLRLPGLEEDLSVTSPTLSKKYRRQQSGRRSLKVMSETDSSAWPKNNIIVKKDESLPKRSAFNPESLLDGILPDDVLREDGETQNSSDPLTESIETQKTREKVDEGTHLKFYRDSPSNKIKDPFEDEDLLDQKTLRRGEEYAERLENSGKSNQLQELQAMSSDSESIPAVPQNGRSTLQPISSLGLSTEQVKLLCSQFASIASQFCSKRQEDPAVASRCQQYFRDCNVYQLRKKEVKDESRPLRDIANSFSSGVGLTYYSFGVNGIPYYPINEEGGVGFGSHGKADFGSWGGGYSGNLGVRDFYSQTEEYGGNWYEGIYGGKTGWSVPIVQSLGVEGGGGTIASVPLKEGQFANPIEVSRGYYVGPYFGGADKVGVDWFNGGVQYNQAVAVPLVGVSVNAGTGVSFPSVDTVIASYRPRQ